VPRPAHRTRRIAWHDLADQAQSKKHPNGGQVLLNVRHGIPRHQLLDVSGDVRRRDRLQLEPVALAPGEKFRHGASVYARRVLRLRISRRFMVWQKCPVTTPLCIRSLLKLDAVIP